MRTFKALSLLSLVAFVTAVPVAQVPGTNVHGTGLDDLGLKVAGQDHHLGARAPPVDEFIKDIGIASVDKIGFELPDLPPLPRVPRHLPSASGVDVATLVGGGGVKAPDQDHHLGARAPPPDVRGIDHTVNTNGVNLPDLPPLPRVPRQLPEPPAAVAPNGNLHKAVSVALGASHLHSVRDAPDVAGIVGTAKAPGGIHHSLPPPPRLLPRDAPDVVGAVKAATASVPIPNLHLSGHGLPSLPVLDTSSTGNDALNTIHKIAAGVGLNDSPVRRDAPETPEVQTPSLPETFNVAIVKLEPIIARLRAHVSLQADLDIDVVVVILEEVIAVLAEVLVVLDVIVKDPTGFTLRLVDVILELPAVAFIIATLVFQITAILTIVAEVVAVVGVTAAATIDPLVAQISNHLTGIITLTLTIVAGIQPLLVATLQPVVEELWYLHIGQVATALGFSAPP